MITPKITGPASDCWTLGAPRGCRGADPPSRIAVMVVSKFGITRKVADEAEPTCDWNRLPTSSSFTLFQLKDQDGPPQVDQLPLVEALRRYADKIAVFCLAGQIHVPKHIQLLLGFLENSVFEVQAPRWHHGGVFHPPFIPASHRWSGSRNHICVQDSRGASIPSRNPDGCRAATKTMPSAAGIFPGPVAASTLRPPENSQFQPCAVRVHGPEVDAFAEHSFLAGEAGFIPNRTVLDRSSKTRILGLAQWTGSSTNASCQPEKPEKSQLKALGPASPLGVDRATQRYVISNEREPSARKNLRNAGDAGKADKAGNQRCRQQKRRFKLGV